MKKLLLIILTVFGGLTVELSQAAPNKKFGSYKHKQIVRSDFASCEDYAKALENKIARMQYRRNYWIKKHKRDGTFFRKGRGYGNKNQPLNRGAKQQAFIEQQKLDAEAQAAK